MKVFGSDIIIDNPLERGYLSFISALLTVIILPIHVQYLPPFMILWVLCRILENHSHFSLVCSLTKFYRLLFILFILYYIWQASGLLYSSDTKMGLSNLFGRLSLILFPLVLIYPGAEVKERVKTLIRVFAISTFLFMLFCFFYALYRSIDFTNELLTFNPHPSDSPWLSYFYSAKLTISQHPSYIAMYVLLAVFICFESWFDHSIKIKIRICWLIIGILLLISQYFLSSRAGILISLILVPLYFIFKFRKLGKKRFSWILIILVPIILLPFIVKNQRVDYLYGRLSQNQSGYERKEDPRIKIWKSALNIARKNLLIGVGIGDVRTELTLEYKRIGEEQMASEQFNAHNQFLEVLLENGIIGLSIFISIFICMFYIALSDKNILYAMSILMLFMFFLFETVLYRFAGVSFFSLFSFLLIYLKEDKPLIKARIQKTED
jgi:O-antigen ligase